MSRRTTFRRAAGAAALLLPLSAPLGAQQFEPGPLALYEARFSADDLPAGLTILGGNVSPVVDDAGAGLRVTRNAVLEITLPEALPSRFTVEVEGTVGWGYAHPVEIRVPLPEDPPAGLRTPAIREKRGVVHCSEAGSGGLGVGYEIPEHQVRSNDSDGALPCHVVVDGDRTQVFWGPKLIADRAPIELGRSDRLHIYVPAVEGGGREATIRRIRVGGYPPDLYGELEKSGRVTAEGIYFDTGSDRLREDSAPVLEQIAQMLTEHAELTLSIEGHTDDVGDPASNQTLSERRAAAVRAYLVEQLGVDGARLTTAGFGSTQPVASNETPDGRQQNRRVELVRR